jgi:hypothetical protein
MKYGKTNCGGGVHQNLGTDKFICTLLEAATMAQLNALLHSSTAGSFKARNFVNKIKQFCV